MGHEQCYGCRQIDWLVSPWNIRQGSLNEDDSGHLSIPVWKDQGQKLEEPIDVGQTNWMIKAAQVITHNKNETSSLKGGEDKIFSIHLKNLIVRACSRLESTRLSKAVDESP